MKKIFTLVMAMMVMAGALNAANTRIYCKMTQTWWTAEGAAIAVHYWGGTQPGTTWPGIRMTAVDGEDGIWYYDIPADVTGLIFVRVNGSGDVADYGAKTANLTLPTDGKNLFTITNTEASWGDPGCGGEWSVYTPSAEPPVAAKFYITGDAEALGAWNPKAIKSTTDTYTLNLAAGSYQLKVTEDGTWETAKGYTELTEKAEGLTAKDNNICFTLKAAGEVKVTYTKAVFKLEGAFAVLADGYYLVGSINDWTPAEAYLFQKNGDVEGEFKLDYTLVAGDKIKVVGVQNSTKTWYPDGNGNEYTVDEAHAGAKTIYFRPVANDAWKSLTEAGFIWIDANATAIDNTELNGKAVKFFENGQLVIEKNGVRYNAQGTVVK